MDTAQRSVLHAMHTATPELQTLVASEPVAVLALQNSTELLVARGHLTDLKWREWDGKLPLPTHVVYDGSAGNESLKTACAAWGAKFIIASQLLLSEVEAAPEADAHRIGHDLILACTREIGATQARVITDVTCMLSDGAGVEDVDARCGGKSLPRGMTLETGRVVWYDRKEQRYTVAMGKQVVGVAAARMRDFTPVVDAVAQVVADHPLEMVNKDIQLLLPSKFDNHGHHWAPARVVAFDDATRLFTCNMAVRADKLQRFTTSSAAVAAAEKWECYRVQVDLATAPHRRVDEYSFAVCTKDMLMKVHPTFMPMAALLIQAEYCRMIENDDSMSLQHETDVGKFLHAAPRRAAPVPPEFINIEDDAEDEGTLDGRTLAEPIDLTRDESSRLPSPSPQRRSNRTRSNSKTSIKSSKAAAPRSSPSRSTSGVEQSLTSAMPTRSSSNISDGSGASSNKLNGVARSAPDSSVKASSSLSVTSVTDAKPAAGGATAATVSSTQTTPARPPAPSDKVPAVVQEPVATSTMATTANMKVVEDTFNTATLPVSTPAPPPTPAPVPPQPAAPAPSLSNNPLVLLLLHRDATNEAALSAFVAAGPGSMLSELVVSLSADQLRAFVAACSKPALFAMRCKASVAALERLMSVPDFDGRALVPPAGIDAADARAPVNSESETDSRSRAQRLELEANVQRTVTQIAVEVPAVAAVQASLKAVTAAMGGAAVNRDLAVSIKAHTDACTRLVAAYHDTVTMYRTEADCGKIANDKAAELAQYVKVLCARIRTLTSSGVTAAAPTSRAAAEVAPVSVSMPAISAAPASVAEAAPAATGNPGATPKAMGMQARDTLRSSGGGPTATSSDKVSSSAVTSIKLQAISTPSEVTHKPTNGVTSPASTSAPASASAPRSTGKTLMKGNIAVPLKATASGSAGMLNRDAVASAGKRPREDMTPDAETKKPRMAAGSGGR